MEPLYSIQEFLQLAQQREEESSTSEETEKQWDQDFLDTDSGVGDTSCTFLEFLKELDSDPCYHGNTRDYNSNNSLHQGLRRNSRMSVLQGTLEDELTLTEFLSSTPVHMTSAHLYPGHVISPEEEEEDDELLSLSQFLGELSAVPPNSWGHSSTRTSSDASSSRDCTDSCSSNKEETGRKENETVGGRCTRRSSSAVRSRNRVLETIASSPELEMFTFAEILADPIICKSELMPAEKNNCSKLDQLLRPILSPRGGAKPPKKKKLSTSSKSLDSKYDYDILYSFTSKSSCDDLHSKKTGSTASSLDRTFSETSLETSNSEATARCTMLEFLLEEPPRRDHHHMPLDQGNFMSDRSTSLFNLQSTQPLYCSKAKSIENLGLKEYSLVEFLNAPYLNPPVKPPSDQVLEKSKYGNLARSFRQLSLGSSSFERDLMRLEILAWRQGSILDDLLGGAMNNPDKAGELRKQGNSRLRDWKNRYCAVKDGTFCYYESYEAYCIATPITSIYCGTLKAQISDRTRFKFEVIVPNRTYYFMAKSEAEMLSWIDALTKAVSAALTDLKSSGSTAKELISRIYEEPSNAFCADCRAPDPKWASINLGVVVCIKCSGSHRILGVHISKVRSLELDVKAWTDDMISVFHRIGNQRANNFFESTLDRSSTSHPSPDSDMKVREAFIEDKYTRGTWSAVIKAPVEELDRQLLQVVQTDELHKTLALLMSGANVKHIDKKQDSNRRTPYLMALASGQKAQAQLLLLNDADPVPPEQAEDVPEQDSMLFDLEGDLDKKGPNAMQSYKKRHCLLSVHGKCMRYYDDHSFKNEIDLRTMIEVTLDDSENPDEEKNTEGYTFLRLRTDTRTYLFRDRDKEYMTTWYQSIRSTQVFGTPLENQPKTHNGIPILIHKCIMFLDTRTDVEGLYRISGAKNRIEKLKLQFNQNVHDVVLSDESTVTHDVTSVLKQYFRELPVSLLGPSNEQLTAAVQIADETEKLYQIQDIIYELPGTEFHVLKFVIQHLYAVAGQQALNKMSSENLGVVFGPTLMSTHEEGKEFNPYEYHLVTTLIDYFPWLFQVDVEMEESKGKELKLAEAELKKIMSQLDAPRGSVDNSWIVEMFHQQNSVNIRIESGQTLRDVSAEILFRAKLVDGDSDYSLSEFLCDGQLQRPIHLSEYLLNTTVTLWEERVQKSWLAIDNNSIKEKLRKFDPPQDNSTEQGTLHIYEGKKKWKEVHCKISSDNFTYSKLKVKSTINLLNYTWYLGCESSLAPPNGPRHCFTLRCLTPKDHKDDIFKVFSASDENELWRWIFRINYVKFKEPDYRLVRSKRATLQNPNNRNSFLLLEHR